MIKKILVCLLVAITLLPTNCYSCSVFYSTNGNSYLAGNSEDWDDLNSMFKFFPAQNGKYGKFIFGFKDWGLEFCSWGGVNDQGLFYDWLSTSKRNPNFHVKGTKYYSGVLADKMLEECATVEEAIALFQKYNCPGIGGAHIFVADKFGNSVVMEEGENNSLAVIRKSENRQIATNFLNAYLSDPKMEKWISCPRYQYINQVLSENDSISVDLFQSILQHVGNNGLFSPTVYSNIYDFSSGKMYIYNFYNFDEVLILDIKTELEKGYRFRKLPELFSKIKAEYPIGNDIVNSSSATFRWMGEAKDYQIIISTDNEFINPTIISYSAPETQEAGFNGIVSICLILLIIFGITIKRKIILTSALTILLSLGCEDSYTYLPDSQSITNHSKTIDNLEAGKVYYWKVVAFNKFGYQTETHIKSFQTSNF